MNKVLTQHKGYEFSTLENIPKTMAEQVLPFFLKMDIERYVGWLEMMYHYTLGSYEKGVHSAEASMQADLKEFFSHMAIEEKNHYKVAESDLKQLDRPLDIEKQAPVVIEKYNTWWNKQYDNPIKLLAALFVFENVAQYLVDDVLPVLNTLNLTKSQCKWIRIHAQADDVHGQEVSELARKYFVGNAEIMIGAAREAAELWININITPLR